MTAEGSSSSRPETGGTTSTSSGDSEKDLQLKRKSSKAYEEEEEEDLQLQRKTSQAYEEGHDADIPSSAGYVLNEKGEQMRKNYLERRRSNTINEKSKSNGTIQRDVEAGAPSQGAEHENDDPNVVWWDGPDDPENPYNWPQWRKVANCSLISGMTFLTPLGSCKWTGSLLPSPVAEYNILLCPDLMLTGAVSQKPSSPPAFPKCSRSSGRLRRRWRPSWCPCMWWASRSGR